VEYRPFIGFLFSGRGIRGWLLQRALHAQHRRVYSYDAKTTYGHVATPPAIAKIEAGDAQKHVPDHEKPEDEADEFAASRQFLKMVHYDEAPGPDVPGGRLYTYVITLQGEWRFTETGPEFAIQFLSKHSMHSDVAPEVAISGEFFVRRRRGKGGIPLPNGIDKGNKKEGEKKEKEGVDKEGENKEKEGDDKGEKKDGDTDTDAKRNFSNASTEAADATEKKPDEESPDSKEQNEEHDEGTSDSKDLKEKHDETSDSKEKPEKQSDKDSIHVSNKPSHQVGHSHNPSNFVLIIDNDSGTYRPDKSQLPSFKKYLERNLPGLKIKVMACDDPKLKKLKEEQKPKKEVTKARRIAQPSDSSDSGSSSDFSETE
jgi:hypothetical protein